MSIISLKGFKSQIQNDPVGAPIHLDYVWRIIIGFGAVPGAIALYFRLTLPGNALSLLVAGDESIETYLIPTLSETPRFTMDVENNVAQASTDVDAFLVTGGFVANFLEGEHTMATGVAPKASWRDFISYFGQWQNGK